MRELPSDMRWNQQLAKESLELPVRYDWNRFRTGFWVLSTLMMVMATLTLDTLYGSRLELIDTFFFWAIMAETWWFPTLLILKSLPDLARLASVRLFGEINRAPPRPYIWLGLVILLGFAYTFIHLGPSFLLPMLLPLKWNAVLAWIGTDLVSIGMVTFIIYFVLYWTRHSGHIEINTQGLKIGIRHPRWPIVHVQDIAWSEFKQVGVTDGVLTLTGIKTVAVPGLDINETNWIIDWISTSKEHFYPIEGSPNQSKSIPQELQALRNEQPKQ